MKKIKIKFCDFNEIDKKANADFILNILKKYYNIEISENPEYLFFHESTHNHIKYNCIKIFYTSENIHPNFNFCDYAIGFDYMNFGDRYYRLPFYLVAPFYSADKKDIELAGDLMFTKPYPFTKDDLSKKTGFCSFVFGNYLADVKRKEFFDKLSTYKKVDSGGTYLNNVGEKVQSKLQFEMKHKFAIVFENSSRVGYTTEKIVNSLAAKTIPIYWGNPEIHKEFNEKRFINCHRYKNFDEIIERVKEIDNNDDLYLNIINEPVTIPSYNFKQTVENFELFLRYIIDQPLEDARRLKINAARYSDLVKNEKVVAKYVQIKNNVKALLAKIYHPFKKIGILEDIKRKYFRKNISNK